MGFKLALTAVLFIASPLTASAAINTISSCLQQASRGGDPMVRDNSRIRCLRSFAPRLDRDTCLRLTRGFEYSGNSEGMKSFCVFELKKDPKVADCSKAAGSMDYGSSRDELVWGCLRRLNLTLSKHDCRHLTGFMVYPTQKARAASYCENELKSSR